jgi:hypothetical protein
MDDGGRRPWSGHGYAEPRKLTVRARVDLLSVQLVGDELADHAGLLPVDDAGEEPVEGVVPVHRVEGGLVGGSATRQAACSAASSAVMVGSVCQSSGDAASQLVVLAER